MKAEIKEMEVVKTFPTVAESTRKYREEIFNKSDEGRVRDYAKWHKAQQARNNLNALADFFATERRTH